MSSSWILLLCTTPWLSQSCYSVCTSASVVIGYSPYVTWHHLSVCVCLGFTWELCLHSAFFFLIYKAIGHIWLGAPCINKYALTSVSILITSAKNPLFPNKATFTATREWRFQCSFWSGDNLTNLTKALDKLFLYYKAQRFSPWNGNYQLSLPSLWLGRDWENE